MRMNKKVSSELVFKGVCRRTRKKCFSRRKDRHRYGMFLRAKGNCFIICCSKARDDDNVNLIEGAPRIPNKIINSVEKV